MTYLQDTDGPLYAYVKVLINGTVYTTEDGYVQIQDDSGIDLTDFQGKYIDNTVVSFSYNRTTATGSRNGCETSSIGSEFNLTLFDDSALFVEELLMSAINNNNGADGETSGVNCHIEYGWASCGKRIDGRYNMFDAYITEYSLEFSGPSITLNITGTSQEAIDLAQASSIDISSVISSGNPTEIVKAICNGFGWDTTNVEDTETVYDESDGKTPKTFSKLESQSYRTYIENVLCPEAQTSDGLTGFTFHTESVDGTIYAYFQPTLSYIDGAFSTQAEDGEDEQGVNAHYGDVDYDTYKQKIEEGINRNYEYYCGRQNSEVISFAPEFKGRVASLLTASSSASIDSAKNEMILCSADGNTYVGTAKGFVDNDGNQFLSNDYGSSRLFGLSSSTFDSLEQSAANLWTTYNSQVYSASLEIMGDPNIEILKYIKIAVYTKYGFTHHTSGVYQVTSAEDSIDGGNFTTSLSLYKVQYFGDGGTDGQEE